MVDIEIAYHPPEEILEIIKAMLDVLTVVAFIGLLVVVIIARKRYPVFEKRGFMAMVGFAGMGIISTFMDAFDEFFWFTPKAFYDQIWKPTRLFLLLIGIFLLVITFYQFYKFSERLFGEEKD
ncbi:MAG: hypothetical protein ACXAEU_03740 [Candidatus Hodarchaeales archaeon]|jgi:hypothetical protein